MTRSPSHIVATATSIASAMCPAPTVNLMGSPQRVDAKARFTPTAVASTWTMAMTLTLVFAPAPRTVLAIYILKNALEMHQGVEIQMHPQAPCALWPCFITRMIKSFSPSALRSAGMAFPKLCARACYIFLTRGRW